MTASPPAARCTVTNSTGKRIAPSREGRGNKRIEARGERSAGESSQLEEGITGRLKVALEQRCAGVSLLEAIAADGVVNDTGAME